MTDCKEGIPLNQNENELPYINFAGALDLKSQIPRNLSVLPQKEPRKEKEPNNGIAE